MHLLARPAAARLAEGLPFCRGGRAFPPQPQGRERGCGWEGGGGREGRRVDAAGGGLWSVVLERAATPGAQHLDGLRVRPARRAVRGGSGLPAVGRLFAFLPLMQGQVLGGGGGGVGGGGGRWEGPGADAERSRPGLFPKGGGQLPFPHGHLVGPRGRLGGALRPLVAGLGRGLAGLVLAAVADRGLRAVAAGASGSLGGRPSLPGVRLWGWLLLLLQVVVVMVAPGQAGVFLREALELLLQVLPVVDGAAAGSRLVQGGLDVARGQVDEVEEGFHLAVRRGHLSPWEPPRRRDDEGRAVHEEELSRWA